MKNISRDNLNLFFILQTQLQEIADKVGKVLAMGEDSFSVEITREKCWVFSENGYGEDADKYSTTFPTVWLLFEDPVAHATKFRADYEAEIKAKAEAKRAPFREDER